MRITLHPLIIAIAISSVTILPANAATNVLDFESPLPGGLVAAIHQHLASVPPESVISTQYVAFGVVMNGVVLLNLGTGSSPSGVNSLGGVDEQQRFNAGSPLTFEFVSPVDGTTAATTDFFSITPDLLNGSDNTVLVSAYALDGRLLATRTYQETGELTPVIPIEFSRVGRIHKVVVAPTLHASDTGYGGIQFDLLSFTTVRVTGELAIRPSQVELCWDSATNKLYQIESRPMVNSGEWTALTGPMQGTGERLCLTQPVAVGSDPKYYRVVLVE